MRAKTLLANGPGPPAQRSIIRVDLWRVSDVEKMIIMFKFILRQADPAATTPMQSLQAIQANIPRNFRCPCGSLAWDLVPGVEVAAGLWCGRRSKMIVCSCGGVSDREICAAIDRRGGDLATILAATGAGQDCGACHEEVERHCRQPCRGSRPIQQTGYPTRRAG